MVGQEFKVNNYITLKLENDETIIYVANERFDQCKFLLLKITIDEIKKFNEIESVDEAAEQLDRSLEEEENEDLRIPLDVVFWAHCSNLQVWVENNYNTRLLHSNLAFPLLKKLTEVGDSLARRIFKEEIAKRYASGHSTVVKYLKVEGYMEYLSEVEVAGMIEDLKSQKINTKYVTYKNRVLEFVLDGNLDLNDKSIENISEIKGLKNLINLRRLDLSNNQIHEIENLDTLRNLNQLFLQNNDITEIKGVNSLINLKILNLKNNKISEIKGVENLSNLWSLNLSNNKISEIKGIMSLRNPNLILFFLMSII